MMSCQIAATPKLMVNRTGGWSDNAVFGLVALTDESTAEPAKTPKRASGHDTRGAGTIDFVLPIQEQFMALTCLCCDASNWLPACNIASAACWPCAYSSDPRISPWRLPKHLLLHRADHAFGHVNKKRSSVCDHYHRARRGSRAGGDLA